MKPHCPIEKLVRLGIVAGLSILATSTFAVPYATSVTNAAGVVSFRLNENADNVKVISGGGSVTNDLGPGVKGLTVTNLGTAAGTIKIVVARSAAGGYTQISSDGFQDNGVYVNKFEQPRGLTVDRNPANPSFGRIYVANGRGQADTAGTFVRTTFQGIYMLNADNTVALDTGTTPRTAGLGFTANNTATPNRLHIGKDDNQLYICDWSDPSGGLWSTDLDVTTGINVLQGIGDLGAGSTTHGSVAAAWVEGTAGTDLKVFTADEDLTPGQSLWRYDIGAAALPYTGAANLVGSPTISTAPQIMDVVRGGSSNYLYLTQRRSTGAEANIFVFTEDGTFVTNSLLASRAFMNNSTNMDLLREVLAADISPDGTTLALLRANVTPTVLLVSLANGVFNLGITNGFNIGSTSSNNRDIAYDAAGNLYVINTSVEWLRIFSKGGSTIATTGTDGTFGITAPPVLISVTNTVAAANEQGPVNGLFTLTRAGDNSAALTVNYTISGTATNGTDYTALPGTVTFLPGTISTNLSIVVSNDTVAEFTETVVFTITSGSGYGIGTAAATLSITDNEPTEISFNTIVTNQLLESYAPSQVTLQLARRGLLNSSVPVNLAYAGAATHGADFSGPLAVTFAANTAFTNITLTPINDQAYEGNELIAANVAAGAYSIGATNAAYVTLVDDEYPAGTILFSDDFNNINSSNQWVANLADPSTDFAEFNWDYSTFGIPVAPGTTDGSTLGLRMRCGNAVLQIDGMSLSPTNGNFTGDYRLKFDMWINYNGPMPDGGPGSTQNFDAGVGTAGDQVVWFNNPSADGIWFTTTGDGADGSTDGDYTAFLGSTQLKDDTGFYAAGVSANPNSGLRNHSHPYYSLWGGHAAPPAQLALFPTNQTGIANVGNAGMAWHTVVITKAADTVKWQIDGITICTVTNDPGILSTNVFVGYQDKFASGNLSDRPELSFGLVDNLKVERFVSAAIRITNIAIVGSNVEITFSGPAEKVATDFKLQGTASATGTFADDNTATLSNLGAGLFKATTALGGANHFYKIKL